MESYVQSDDAKNTWFNGGDPLGGGRSSKFFLRAFVLRLDVRYSLPFFCFFVTIPTPDFTKNNSLLAQPIPFLVFNVCCDTIALH